MYSSFDQLTHDLQTLTQGRKKIADIIDSLIYSAVFSPDNQIKKTAQDAIWDLAEKNGIYSASILPLYRAVASKEISGFTVPAINVKTLTYDTARIFFQSSKKHNIGPFIFEIAPTEMDYTHQRPKEYTTAIFAAALKEQYSGPIFIQGDHFQLSLRRFTQNADEEIQRVKSLIDEAIDAHFYNIDIDASTLVDLTKSDLDQQQQKNYQITAELFSYIRTREQHKGTIAIGGEIGHIGGTNSTVTDFEAFMNGFLEKITHDTVSKVSVQTGTSHGGTPLSDGTVQKVAVDFTVLSSIAKVAQEKYHIAGPVQHGASTLPIELFDKFPQNHTIEIHLATGFQNTMYDHLPTSLKNDIYGWLKENLKNEWEDGWSEEQFLYKTRKKAAGPFKEKLWTMPDSDKQHILNALQHQFETICEKLHVFNTRDYIKKYISS